MNHDIKRPRLGVAASAQWIQLAHKLALTPALSPGERVNHTPSLVISEAMDCR
jgi:hypothetical protein